VHFTVRKEPIPSQSRLGPAWQPVRRTQGDRTWRAAAELPAPALCARSSRFPGKPALSGAFPHGGEGRQVSL